MRLLLYFDSTKNTSNTRNTQGWRTKIARSRDSNIVVVLVVNCCFGCQLLFRWWIQHPPFYYFVNVVAIAISTTDRVASASLSPIQQQGFPENFRAGTQPKLPSTTRRYRDTVRVNTPGLVRPSDCSYGRLFTQWRHSVTNNDTNPLPTVSK